MIGKLETFQEDFRYLSAVTGIVSGWVQLNENEEEDDDIMLNVAGMEKVTADTLFKVMSVMISSSGLSSPSQQSLGGAGSSSFDRAIRHFCQLDRDRRRRLYEAYKEDFDMFGYDPEPFLTCQRADEDI